MKPTLVPSGPSNASSDLRPEHGDGLVESLRSDDNMDPGLSGPNAGSSNGPIEFISFAATGRTRIPGPRPSSPPRRSHFNPRPSSSSSTAPDHTSGANNVAAPGPPKSSGSMGPPAGLVRRTRKSMKGFAFEIEESTRKESLIIPLPDSETPMIRKNKALREEQRRSSLGARGQRASSSLGKGEISESRGYYCSSSLRVAQTDLSLTEGHPFQ